MRRRSARAGAALAAVTILLSTPDAARADDPWIRMACFSGAIDQVTVSNNIIAVDGHVNCGQSWFPRASIMYALYRDKRGVAYWSTMNYYDSVGPTPDSIRKDLPAGDFGLCLVTDYTVRAACVAVDQKPDGTVTVQKVPTDDPLVDWPVVVVGYDAGSDPACGTCW